MPSQISAALVRERLYSHPLLLALFLTYTCNFMDRSVIATLAQAIKVDLALSDTQLGLLQGFAFVALYSVMGLPIASVAERRDRVTLIAVCMTAWSLLTMLCGLAQNFGQLLLLRIGVGVGEAGCTAPAHSMIADAIAPERRSQALSIYNLGGTCGTMLGAMSGGVIAEHLGWRAAFLIVGAPGLILATFMRLRVGDPGRKQLHVATGATAPDVSAAAVARTILRSPALRHLALGLTLSTFAVAGLAAFVQPYYIRNFGLSYGQVGLMFGAVTGVAGMLSLLLSGRLADALARRDARWYAWLPAIGVGIAAPLSVMAYTALQWPVALALTLVSTFFVGWFVAPTIGGFHNMVGPRRVAMAIALLLMFQNLVGFGAGPYFTGVAIDFFARHTTSARATQLGLLATLLLEPWAIVHFLLAARGLRRELPSVPTA